MRLDCSVCGEKTGHTPPNEFGFTKCRKCGTVKENFGCPQCGGTKFHKRMPAGTPDKCASCGCGIYPTYEVKQ